MLFHSNLNTVLNGSPAFTSGGITSSMDYSKTDRLELPSPKQTSAMVRSSTPTGCLRTSTMPVDDELLNTEDIAKPNPSPSNTATLTDLGLISTYKLSKLSPELQRIIYSLSPAELRNLKAAFSSQFHFFALPRELRDMVYDLVLMPIAFNFRRPLNRHEQHKILGMTILFVCKQAYYEGRVVFYARRSFHLVPNRPSVLDGINSIPLAMARHMTLDLSVGGPLISYVHGTDRLYFLTILRAATNLYEKEYKAGNRQPKHLHVNLKLNEYLVDRWANTFPFSFRFHGRQSRTLHDVERSTVRMKIWLRVQLHALVNEMRADLHTKSPNVTLTGNVDTQPDHTILTRRVSHKVVRFHEPNVETGELSVSFPLFDGLNFKRLDQYDEA
jgi:hypothetical protein